MPAHGIRLDLEFAGIAASAAILSLFMTQEVISNVLFTALISGLFFLIGLNLDIPQLKKCSHYQKEIILGGSMIYLLTPLAALLTSYFVPESLGNAFIAIGVSAAAIGSPVVFSNRGKGEGNLALIISGLSLFAGFLIIPLLLFGMDIGFPAEQFAVKNLLFLGLPLILGIGSQRYHNMVLEDFKHHFSKLALWLIILVMAIQFQLVYQARGLEFLTEMGSGLVLMTGFVLFSYLASYIFSREMGVMERNARTIGFVSGSKGIAVALFIASQFGGEAVAYVSVYYFVRQGVIGLISEYFHHGDFRIIERFRPDFV